MIIKYVWEDFTFSREHLMTFKMRIKERCNRGLRTYMKE